MIGSSSQDCFIRVHQIERTEKAQFDINQYSFSIEKEGIDVTIINLIKSKTYQFRYQVIVTTIWSNLRQF
jgi:hypothetical protein